METPFETAWTLLKMKKAWYDEETSLHEDPNAPHNKMPSEEEMHYAPMDDMEEEIMDRIMLEHDDPEMGRMAWEHWVHQNTDRGEFDAGFSSGEEGQGLVNPAAPVEDEKIPPSNNNVKVV